jgi:amidophosphoribosyltransferase
MLNINTIFMCGILAYYSSNQVISLQIFIHNLKKLYHRGQDSVGISYVNEGVLTHLRCKTFEELLNKTKNVYSLSILGHTKYTTSGEKNNSVDQPILSNNKFGEYCLIYNGNIPINNYYKSNTYSNDTMMIIDFLNNNASNHKNWKDLCDNFMDHFERAYNIIIQTKDTFYILKDTYGVRPLTYTCFKNSNTYTFSSESSVFQNTQFVYEIPAGTLYGLNKYGLKELINYPNLFEKHCLFEYIYFLNKDSLFEHTSVKSYRSKIGKLMALRDKEYFNNLNKEFIVCGVPNTGNDYAKSYAENIEFDYKDYILKNSEISRTFILSNDEERNKYANAKYLFDKNIKNKNIIIIDDSIVRGITLKNLIRNLKEFGVLCIYVVIASPPINNTCSYGIDIPTKEELIINKIPEKDLHHNFGCERIKYLDLSLLDEALPDYYNKCTLCLNPDPNLEW